MIAVNHDIPFPGTLDPFASTLEENKRMDLMLSVSMDHILVLLYLIFGEESSRAYRNEYTF